MEHTDMQHCARDGGFSDLSYVGVGDPYAQKKAAARGLGGDQKPFLTCPPKKGQIAATLGPGFRKFEGLDGSYSEPYKLEAKRRLENTQKFVKPSGFSYSAPAKNHTGAGDYYGAFNKIERDEDDIKKAQAENTQARPNPKDKTFEKKNMLTNPGKRGTFGYAGTLIGGSAPPAVAADFESERRAAASDREKHKRVMGDKKAFKSTTTGVDYFDAHEHVAAPRLLGWDDTCVVKPPAANELLNPKERAVANASTFKPWKPNNPLKDGEQGSFDKFTEQQPDPYDQSVINRAMLPNRRHPIKSATKDLPDALRERKVFRPTSFPKTKLTKSTCLVGISKHTV